MANAIVHEVDTIAGAPASLIERLRRSYADYRMYRRTLDELGALSDRELTDLGLLRQDIRSIAHESVYGD